MGRQERMTEQKGERIGGKAQLIPERWEGRREALRGQSRVLPPLCM